MTVRQLPFGIALKPAVVVSLLAAVISLAVAMSGGYNPLPYQVAAVSLLAITLFATRVIPETTITLFTFLAFLGLAAAPPEVIFSGFATGGFWLLFSGLLIGTAITATGLGRQIALRIFRRTGASYPRAVISLAICGVMLGVLVPSTIPRIIVLMPISMSLAQTMGYEPGSRGYIGLTAIAATSTLLPTFAILTANLPTIVHFGALETLFGLEPAYAHYFVMQFPVNLVRLLVLLAFLVPFAKNSASTDPSIELPEPLTGQQLKLLLMLAIAIAFWATDFLHGISPAWIALTLAAILMLPSLGFLEKTVMKDKVDMSPAFFLAGVFCISAVMRHIGLDTQFANAVIPQLGLGENGRLWDLYATSGLAMFMSQFTTAPAAPLILAPLAQPMAEATGLPLETVAMAQIIGIATPLLPYQAPPLILAMAMAQIPMRILIQICLVLALAVAVIGLPITYLWWQLLGAF
ncbi:MAG: SLC13 family permease [Pseudomonadota bacterium]